MEGCVGGDCLVGNAFDPYYQQMASRLLSLSGSVSAQLSHLVSRGVCVWVDTSAGVLSRSPGASVLWYWWSWHVSFAAHQACLNKRPRYPHRGRNVPQTTIKPIILNEPGKFRDVASTASMCAFLARVIFNSNVAVAAFAEQHFLCQTRTIITGSKMKILLFLNEDMLWNRK